MKRLAIALAGIATVALFATPEVVLAQGEPDSVTGFKLPPSTSNTPQAQGPIVEGVPLPRAPRPTPAPTAPVAVEFPTTAPAQSEAPAPAPSPAPTASATAGPARSAPPASTPATQRNAASATDTGSEAASATPIANGTNQAVINESSVPALPEVATPAATATPSATAQLPTLPPSPTATGSWADKWFWLLGGFILAWIIAGVFWLWRQRHETGGRLLAPPIERPRPRATAEAEPEPALAEEALPEEDLAELAAGGASSLRCTLEATRLSLSLLNVTLSYRLTLHNVSNGIIRDIAVGSDLVTAHASLPMNQQVAGTEHVLQPQHSLPLLLPGQNTQLSGELRLPIPAIHPLRRGNAVMFVPLLRLRIDAHDLDQIVLQTVVIGQKPAGPGAGLRPFRLDLGPRVYGEIGHKLLSAQS